MSRFAGAHIANAFHPHLIGQRDWIFLRGTRQRERDVSDHLSAGCEVANLDSSNRRRILIDAGSFIHMGIFERAHRLGTMEEDQQ
jgi:hypothetical protein